MHPIVKRHRLTILLVLGLAVGGASAATSTRTIQSAGTAQLRNSPTGQDGLQSPEFSPTFANTPLLQDGPEAASNPDTANRSNAAAAAATRGAPGRSTAFPFRTTAPTERRSMPIARASATTRISARTLPGST